jgi:hypothetical protein
VKSKKTAKAAIEGGDSWRVPLIDSFSAFASFKARTEHIHT